MNYTKPEVTVLGDATLLIQGTKAGIDGDGLVQPVYDLDE